MKFQYRSLLKTSLTVLVVSYLITGCSTRFVYNQLDWLAPWYLDDYVTIEHYQQDLLTSSLDSVLDWHRATQLSRYGDFLKVISSDVQGSISEEKVAKYFLQLDEFIETLFIEFANEFTPLIAQMNPRQQAELIENLAIKNQKYYEKFVLIGEAESKASSKKRVEKFLDDWLDELSASQVQMINQWSTQTHWLSPGFYESRQAWQTRLHSIFNAQNANKPEMIKSMFKNRREFWSVDLRQKFRHNQQVTTVFIVNFFNSLDANQKQSLLKKLEKYEADFRLLASQSN
mgnify:CR=1 FL=1